MSLPTGFMLTYIWLLKTYAIPASIYASQIWSTPFLQQGKEMDNPVQKWLLTVLNRILGVRDTSPSWCVMQECGLEPIQFNWFRATMLFTILWPNATALLPNKFYMRTCDWAPGLTTSGLPIFSAMIGPVKSTCSNKSCGTVNPLTSWGQSDQLFCCGPQRKTLGDLDTLFWWLPTSAQQQNSHP